jgi:phenylpropionate dioxygenase-like ring-hydroxylating dioxygenase large terminal subunit
MYQAQTSLEPPLPPAAYWEESAWQQERSAVFAQGWHLVGAASSLQQPGAYVTAELLGVPVLVRNFGGELVALRNVCAHRQAILATKPSGCSPTLKCPYHGWEYGADGRTRKIPEALNFPKFDREQYCLDTFALEQCGDLVFVRLSQEGPSLREVLGERFDLLAGWFSTEMYELAMFRRIDYPANWKIPVEASLESYHVPFVHPQTFHDDPGDARSEHAFYDTGSSFETIFFALRWIDRRMRDAEWLALKVMGMTYTGDYRHHHVFPNIMVTNTNSLSLVQVVHPSTPEKSYVLAWQYARLPERKGFIPRWWGWCWGQFAAWLTRTILAEDIAIYPLVQAGVTGSRKTGVLGRCEERLYAFQKFIRDRIDAAKQPNRPCTCGAEESAALNATEISEREVGHD